MNPSNETTTLLDPAELRADFPILARQTASGAPLAYLDNAASTQHPQQVIDAISECYSQYYSNVHRGIHTLSEESTHRYELARGRVARFIGAASDREIIFTAGTTAGVNTVARTWGDANLTAGDVVLLPISEHHANIVPWHQLAQRVGCQVVFIPLDEDYLISSEVVADYLAKYQPKLFAFAAASNALGTEYPVADWTELAHAIGATVLVDAAQAAPHHTIDVADWDADFVVFSGHKLCGPTGIGVLHGRESILDAMPPFMGGGGMIHRVTTDGFTAHELPEKFEAGTPPISEAIGLAAAIDYIDAIGVDRIHAHERSLCGMADAAIRQIDGVQVFGPTAEHKAGIVSFSIDGVHAHDVSQFLDTKGIAVRAGHHCTMPLHKTLGVTATTRASFYLYNTQSEAERFVDAVREVKTKFARSGRRRTRQ